MTDPFVLLADRVWTGQRGQPVLPDAGVVVRDGRLDAVGPAAEILAAAPAVRRIRADGCTVLPGLIDGHVHLAFTPGADQGHVIPATADGELAALMAGRAQHMLSLGVTTVRDLGDRGGLAARLRDAIGRGDLVGPRVLAAGPPVTPHHGHCWFLGGGIGDAPGDVTRQVAHLASLGVDWVKVMATGGLQTIGGANLWESQFDEAALAAVVAAAHSHGLPVAAHAHSARAVADAAAAGADTIEHVNMIDATGTGIDLDDAVAERVVASGAWVCHADGQEPWVYERVMGPENAALLAGRTRWLVDRGVPLFTGTDSGVGPFDRLVPALGYQADRFPAADLLHMATSDAAAALRLGDVTGRLAPGLDADVLVVHGDPLADVAALREVALVVRAGRIVHTAPGRTRLG